MTASGPHPDRTARASNQRCFHCNEPLLGSTLQANVGGQVQSVCCAGCLAVAELIATSGLGDFYKYRDTASARPDAIALREDPWRAYERVELAAQFIAQEDDSLAVYLSIEGLRCAACAWLVDRTLTQIAGVRSATVNAANGHARVSWSGSPTLLADVLRTIAKLGYQPHVLGETSPASIRRDESRAALKRLLVASFGMMQVMMFAVATYSANLNHELIDPALANFFRIVSLMVATPVMFYSGAPLFRSAWNSVRARFVGMDVPVVLALVLAYAASVWNAIVVRSGEVYFDSVTMFVFFLTLSRFIHAQAQRRTVTVSDALAKQMPALAHRLGVSGLEDIAVSALNRGDVIVVRTGEVVPADGEIRAGTTSLDESLLTGESLPVARQAGDRITAGTVNLHHPIEVSVRGVGSSTVIAHVVALMRRARSQKPAMSTHADAAAARFLRYVLLGAVATCAAWLVIDPARAFDATLAVLVVVCPCAFAIAMPSALAAATSNLAEHGILVTQPDALEALARIDRAVFDKTGTLTRGDIEVARCTALGAIGEQDCLRIAAALEQASEHPLARAFAPWADGKRVDSIEVAVGRGVQATLDGQRYRVGTQEYVTDLHHDKRAETTLAELSETAIALGDEHRTLALFELTDSLRADAASTIQDFRKLGIESHLVSGDGREAVVSIARRTGIPDCAARRTPKQKLAYIQALQADGHRVAMIGDGVNDAPVLGAADVSIAMGRGAALSHASADMILVNENLHALPHAVRLARRTLRIAKQNLRWSAAYNFVALPLAALGLIPPWLAALGMSASSIAVVLNAMRLVPRTRKSRHSQRATLSASTAISAATT
jgi:Cu2+-exporting ATPase